jgi:hypothetical protein
MYGDTETISGTVPYSQRILPQGETAFGSSAGLAGEEKDTLLYHGYFRRGITDWFSELNYTEMPQKQRS